MWASVPSIASLLERAVVSRVSLLVVVDLACIWKVRRGKKRREEKRRESIRGVG